MVATLEWTACNGWWNCRSTHSLLEHAHSTAASLSGHRLPSLQPNVLEDDPRDCQHARLLLEPDYPLEVPEHAEDLDVDWSLMSRSLPLN